MPEQADLTNPAGTLWCGNCTLLIPSADAGYDESAMEATCPECGSSEAVSHRSVPRDRELAPGMFVKVRLDINAPWGLCIPALTEGRVIASNSMTATILLDGPQSPTRDTAGNNPYGIIKPGEDPRTTNTFVYVVGISDYEWEITGTAEMAPEKLLRRNMAIAMVKLRDTGRLTPWAEFSRGPGTQSFSRDLDTNPEGVLMLVRGKSYEVCWAVTGPSSNPNVILAAGVIRKGPPAMAGTESHVPVRLYDQAKMAADEALARLDPANPDTYTPNLSDEDRSALRHRELLDGDTLA